MKYHRVIWDWNGTLLDDTLWCIDVENRMLKARGMPTIPSLRRYHDVFCFPVRDYYRALGYDFAAESYEDLSKEYNRLYREDDTGKCPVFPDAREALERFRRAGVRQVILSASGQAHLLEQVRYAGIERYFDQVLGLNDIYAHSKVELAQTYLRENPGGNVALIGDTVHDAEVADALGVDCVLIARGHQAKDKLIACGAPVYDDMEEALAGFFGWEGEAFL
jgi:phosphoglycolate phosphatase